MGTKQIILAGAGLAVAAVVGFIIFQTPDAGVIVHSPDTGSERESAFQARQPAPLNLEDNTTGRADDGDPGESRSGTGSKGDVDKYRQAHLPRLGGARPQRAGRDLEPDAGAGGPEVRSELPETERLADPSIAAAARARVDDWPEDDVLLADPIEPRQPEEGEVLSLFDGDPMDAQAQAAIENGVTFDEEGATFSLDSEYAVPMAGRMSGESGTLSFWVRPNGETSDFDNASLVQLRSQHEWANRLQIWKDGGNIRMVFADGGGTESGTTYGRDSWPDDEWRQVTATWGEGMTALYVNGLLAGTSQYEGGFQIRPKTLLHIGSNYKDDPRSLSGAVNQFRVYDRPLSPDEVAELTSQYPE